MLERERQAVVYRRYFDLSLHAVFRRTRRILYQPVVVPYTIKTTQIRIDSSFNSSAKSKAKKWPGRTSVCIPNDVVQND